MEECVSGRSPLWDANEWDGSLNYVVIIFVATHERTANKCLQEWYDFQGSGLMDGLGITWEQRGTKDIGVHVRIAVEEDSLFVRVISLLECEG